MLEAGNEDSSDPDEDVDRSPRENREDPEWVPGSSYLQKKSHSDDTTDDFIYIYIYIYIYIKVTL
jgi:hypothetical protein